MKFFEKVLFLSLGLTSTHMASANELRRINWEDLNPIIKENHVIPKLPINCLSCPDLSKLPKFEDHISTDDRKLAIAQLNKAMRNLKDLPDISADISTSVDFWERLNPREKEAILGHKFGNNYNWAAAAVVVGAAALAWDVYKDYRANQWTPADMGFDKLKVMDNLDYIKTPNFRLDAVNNIQSRLRAFEGLSAVSHGLNP